MATKTKIQTDSCIDAPPFKVRSMRAGEEDEFLELVAHWPFRDDRRGEEFFARSLEFDPSYEPSNIWIAEVEGEFVGCCQIFPRTLRIGGELVPAGGLGTVFTASDYRRQGIAEQVIRGAIEEMRRRRYELALLWTGRFSLYEKLGFSRWGSTTCRWQLADGVDHPQLLGPSLTVAQFEPKEHFESVRAIAASYNENRHGVVYRSEADWDASLALAGNPVEEFVVALDSGLNQVVAYLRGCMLDGRWQVLEWACAPGHESHLAELIAATLRTVGQEAVLAPRLGDPRLEDALLARGLHQVREANLSASGNAEWMLCCLDPEALIERFLIPAAVLETLQSPEVPSPPNALLELILPPPAFHFWTADRF